MAKEARLNECRGFDWAEANAAKIWEKHEVTPSECEQVFLDGIDAAIAPQ